MLLDKNRTYVDFVLSVLIINYLCATFTPYGVSGSCLLHGVILLTDICMCLQISPSITNIIR